MRTSVLLVVGSLVNGGIERVVANIACGLDKDKFKVYLLCTHPQGDIYSPVLIENGVEVFFYNNSNEKKIIKHFELYRYLDCFLKKHPDISVLHNHSSNQSTEILLAAKHNKIPIICEHAHGSYSAYFNPSMFSLETKLASLFDRIFIKNIPSYRIGCSRAACVSHFESRDNQYFIPNGIDLNKFDLDKYESKNLLRKKYLLGENYTYITFVGRFAKEKNPLFILDVFNYVLKSNENVRFIIVGHGEMEGQITDKINQLHLKDYITLFPHDSNVPEILKMSDYFISPSLFEGLGIVFVEAQLMGLPAFASDQVPKDADLGMCEFVPIDKGPEEYAKYIIDYINNNKKNEKALIPELIDMYDMKNVIKAYEAIYTNDREKVKKYMVESK